MIGESGDILARYRIPVENNQVDYQLQLPEDSDSSVFTSDEENSGGQSPGSGANAGKAGGSGAENDGVGDAEDKKEKHE